jgi:CxxC-x17-CxxC domain-containing protein
MSLQDINNSCFDCGVTFTFSVEEQEAYLAKGYSNAPKRCPACREVRKSRQISESNSQNRQSGFRSERRLFPTVCTQCGKNTQVPFEPIAGRSVFCRECYSTIKVNR